MNATRAPVAFDLRTVESRAPRGEFAMAVSGALKPGAFYDSFKRTGERPRWALAPPSVTRSVRRAATPAAKVRARDIPWCDNAPGESWMSQRDRSVTERVAATEALRRADAQQAGVGHGVSHDDEAQLRHILMCLKSAPLSGTNVWRIPLMPLSAWMDTASNSLSEPRTVDAHRCVWRIPSPGEPWRFHTLDGWQCEFAGTTVYWPDPINRNPDWLD